MLTITACVQRTGHHYEQQILGKWRLVSAGSISKDRMGNSIMDRPGTIEQDNEMTFLTHNACDIKTDSADDVHSSRALHTHYKIRDHSLQVFNPDKNKWGLVMIRYLDADTLVMVSGDTTFVKAARMRH